MSEQPKPEYARPRGERLDVVLCRKGVLVHNAKSSDLRRVTVVADGPYEAQTHVDVTNAMQQDGGWTFVQVCKPGVPQEFETLAKRREAAELTDRTKL